jgi:UDP-2-acetamido-2,6-beta-L-arabino-hexul-4-ose reductase
LTQDKFSYPLELRSDERGELFEWIKSESFGQIFVSTTKPGVTRGNHYHHTKTEKFLVIKGVAEIKFRKIDSDEVIIYIVDGNKPTVLDIPPGYTHSISNISTTELITLFWANEIFDSENPDTYFLNVV